MLILEIMNSAHLSVSQSAARPKAKRTKKRPRSKASSNGHSNGEAPLAAAGTLTRTKSLLLAALRVWELKHRVGE